MNIKELAPILADHKKYIESSWGSEGSFANPISADLSGATGLKVTPAHFDLLLRVASQVAENPEMLEMASIHAHCGTAHCAAGWICTFDSTASALD